MPNNKLSAEQLAAAPLAIEKVKDIVKQAGEILLSKAEAGFSIYHKGRIDLVTDADRASEEYLKEALVKAFPKASILGEESGWLGGEDAEYAWVIDPLDGTTNFAHGFPHYSVSVALVKERRSVMGIVYNPVSEEMFAATLGGGAYLNGHKIQVSENDDVQGGLFLTGFPYDMTRYDNMENFRQIKRLSQGVRINGSAALDLCYVACGRGEAYWERGINAWDIAAGSLIVTEAGGTASHFDGGELDLFAGEILASNGRVHEELVAILGK